MAEVLALRHVAFEDLGLLGPLLAERGHTVRYLDTPTDDLGPVDPLGPGLVVVLGGPIGAGETEAYPFLAGETELVRRRLAGGAPTLGLCLGAQIMARALGAAVHPGPVKEIGWAPVRLTPAGETSVLAPLDEPGAAVLHWHGDRADLPEGAVRLASTPLCETQAFAWQDHALALQFHPEVTARTLEAWFVGHTIELASTPGVTVARLREDTQRHAEAAVERGRRIFDAWLGGLGL